MNDIENKHNVDCWLKSVSKLDLKLKSDINPAIQLLNGAPQVIFGPVITESQNEDIAYWLELCQQLVNFYQNNGDYELAFRYKQFCYSKLQALAIAPQQDEAIKRWCIKKLEIMIINMLEYCQQQPTVVWQNESQQLIDAHVHYMQSMNHQNLSLGSVFVAPQ
ncbi:hypothetical protein C9J01_03250 [Photobacterium rosenbergii]|uniref:Transcriptional regulator n=1 Tax=Photobacterium rosenbergii TaxID=294936 RepID=A0A2T3NKK1_9GAMM|nr:hypothetical protein [Photobacterium rosenbergii]PSW16038.1 hypothetical protein C9J01_03250 [Photobacterium rosenbergii]